MFWHTVQNIVLVIQHMISFCGIMIILSGVLLAIYQYIRFIIQDNIRKHNSQINSIRLDLGRTLILGLEFIVAADLISTIVTPDYYSIGIVAIVVAIRTLLNFSLNREITALSQQVKEIS